jgi:ATP-binding protein involved in chromosome partitioning
MMGLKGAQPNVNAQNKIEPLVRYGIKTMSIGFMVDEKSAIIWRGPMLFKAIDQFLKDVEWGELDYLVVDLPPGTGDVQLSLVQKVLVSGAVIVSTPQDIALMDVKRCVDMFERVKIPVLGVVENMYKFVCPHCHQESDLFFKGELHKYCEEHKIQLLGQVPFNPKIGEEAEKGNPQTIEKDVFTRAAQEIIKKLG